MRVARLDWLRRLWGAWVRFGNEALAGWRLGNVNVLKHDGTNDGCSGSFFLGGVGGWGWLGFVWGAGRVELAAAWGRAPGGGRLLGFVWWREPQGLGGTKM
jgi:hypothetical protein